MRALPGLLALTLGLVACRGEGPGAEALPAFPPPPSPAAAAVDRDDFAGAGTCASCHEEQYASWSRSTHGRAGGPPGPATVIAPFDGVPIRFADATVTPQVRGGAWEFVVRQEGLPPVTYGVDGVIGGGHMLGGGTQGFLTALPDGTHRFLPWDWSRSGQAWFCNTGSRLDRGWLPITRELRLADCGDWPPSRPLGAVSRWANCQECHGSQIGVVLDTAAHEYRTRYTTLQVNCESCHGPAGAHVAWARAGASGPDPAIGSLAWLDEDEALSVCFRCHALKDVLREGYLPGEPLERYYALKFPVLGDLPYTPDGRTRTFAYQEGHLASACYLDGPMDCGSCHDPHGLGYRDTDGRPLASPWDDGQCTSCHPSKLVDPGAHTHHATGSAGSRCVSCHMPYLQHPEVGPRVAFARSDHTISIPRPSFDADLGIVGACAQCHEDLSASVLEERARAWWGELRPHRALVEGQLDELRARNLTEAAALLLRPDEDDPLLQFQALARLLTAYLPPDAADVPDDVVRRLAALASGPDLDVRALALASLHWVRGSDRVVRGVLIDALEEADDDEALRGRWVLALGFLGDSFRDGDQPERAEAAYRKALELRPGDPAVREAWAALRARLGDPEGAARLLRESVDADPLRPLAWAALGSALAATGDPSGARQAYGRALELDPREPVALFNLGNLLQRAGDLAGAAEAYRRAVGSDPGMGPAHFELARVLILQGLRAEALPHARRAVEFRPDHAPSRAMLADLLPTGGGR